MNRITKAGDLKLDRKGNEIHAACIYKKYTSCNHICPFFGDPWPNNDVIELELCQRPLRFRKSEFIDERQ